MQIITLTTDFGTHDWFVGTVKGVILGIAPRVQVVDITHDIPGGEIRAAAFALASSCCYFPAKTIHIAVVDPGVGSNRGAIAVQTADYLFVGPDNGVLSWALRQQTVKEVRRLANENFFLRPVSQTFHGRDIFAPVAAHLSKGMPFAKIGPEVKHYLRLPWPKPIRARNGSIRGEIVHIDRFGNAITNIHRADLAAHSGGGGRVFIHDKTVGPLDSYYQAVPLGQTVGLIGSSGYLEIAVNGGEAAQVLKLNLTDEVVVQYGDLVKSSRP